MLNWGGLHVHYVGDLGGGVARIHGVMRVPGWVLVLAFVALVFAGQAHADVGTVPADPTLTVPASGGGCVNSYLAKDGKCYQFWVNTAAGSGFRGWHSTGREACGEAMTYFNGLNGTYTYLWTGATGYYLDGIADSRGSETQPQCAFEMHNRSNDTFYRWDVQTEFSQVVPGPSGNSCPMDADWNTAGACQCIGGATRSADGQSCVKVDPCQALAGSAPNALGCTGDSCRYYAGSSAARTPCVATEGTSCSATGDLVVAWGEPDGKWGIQLQNVRYTGQKCSGTDGGSGSGSGTPDVGNPGQEISPADVGKCPGTVNGVQVMVACSWTKTEDKKTERPTNADGTSGDAKETTSSTECKDGKCVTTTVTTSTSSSGTSTTTSGTSTGSKNAFCAGNPSDPQCGDQSAWGGSCSAGFTCSGDAVMCAAARGVWDQKCALVDGPASPTSEQQAFAAAKAASGPVLPASSVTISSANFDSSNALGVAAQCIPDQVVTVWGTSVNLAFSNVCPWLGTLGTVMLGVAWLLAAVIVGKGVVGS